MNDKAINGDIKGVKESVREALEQLYDIRLSPSEFISEEMTRIMAEATGETGREVSVFISRGGWVLDVSLGDTQTVSLPYIRKRRGSDSLSGARCVHTHPGGTSMLSEVDISTLLSSRLDAMAAVSVAGGQAKSMCVGFVGEELNEPVIYGPFSVHRVPQKALMTEIENATVRVALKTRLMGTAGECEKVMLLGLNTDQNSMDELAGLAKTAGAEIVSVETQTRVRDSASYIGKGKARELSLKCAALSVDAIIVNDELTPAENRNLEEITGVKVIDRTTLILDIFAAHAKTREGSVQVELAQLKYSLPRLSGQGVVLSRLGGGIGTRGPGEKKLEVDRRRLRRRIYELEQEIALLQKQRALQRGQRKKNRMKEVALAGYTNAGKSSLLNALTDAGALAEDKLFATLDPVTRKLELPSGTAVLLTDTVGFIEKLPHELISAFKSTLEQVAEADLILNVVDAGDERAEEKTKVVMSVLDSIGAGDKPILDVYNKCDLLSGTPEQSGRAAFVSAREKTGLEALLTAIDENLKPRLCSYQAKLKYSEGAKLARINEFGEEIEIEYGEEFMSVSAKLPPEIIKQLS